MNKYQPIMPPAPKPIEPPPALPVVMEKLQSINQNLSQTLDEAPLSSAYDADSPLSQLERYTNAQARHLPDDLLH